MEKLNNFEYPNLVYCPFPAWMGAKNPYFCYHGEKCCDEGCCFTINRMGNIWYYWIMLMFLCGVFYVAVWYCKQCWSSSSIRNNINPCQVNRPVGPMNNNSNNDDIALDQLYVSFRNKDPPSYNTVTKQDQENAINFYEPPPQYSSSTSTEVRTNIPVEVHQQKQGEETKNDN